MADHGGPGPEIGTSPAAPVALPVPGGVYDVRRDGLTGTEVVVVGARQGRPHLPATGCPFCVGGVEAPEPYHVRWFPNRWPPLPDGRAEVILYSPDHDATFASLSSDHAADVVELWADRTEALGSRPDVAYVLAFENRGAAVGATIAHPHGQIYAFDHVPPAPAVELAADVCALCDRDDERLVVQVGDWAAWVPWAPTWPFEVRVAPRPHLPDLPSARSSARDAAAVLVDVAARYDQLFGAAMPSMMWWHQRPTDGGRWPAAHVHAHLAPLWRAADVPRFVAAGELGSGVMFNPVIPEEAAARLRAVRGSFLAP